MGTAANSWVLVRIPEWDVNRAMLALAGELRRARVKLEADPIRATDEDGRPAPEVELQIHQPWCGEAGVRSALVSAGVDVLASAVRDLGPWLEKPGQQDEHVGTEAHVGNRESGNDDGVPRGHA